MVKPLGRRDTRPPSWSMEIKRGDLGLHCWRSLVSWTICSTDSRFLEKRMTPPGLYSLRKAARSADTLVPRKPTMNSCPIFSRDVNSRRATSQAPIDEVLDQQPGADPGRPFRNVGPFPLAPIGAGNVNMHPGPVARKFAQKESRRDHSPAASPDVAHI